MTQPRVDQVRERITAAAQAQAAVRQAAQDAGAAIAAERDANRVTPDTTQPEGTGG